MSEMLTKVSWAVGMAMIHADMKVNKVITDAAARAAIEAMREPTEAMIDAAYVATERDDRWQIEDAVDFIRAWRAGIDEALK